MKMKRSRTGILTAAVAALLAGSICSPAFAKEDGDKVSATSGGGTAAAANAPTAEEVQDFYKNYYGGMGMPPYMPGLFPGGQDDDKKADDKKEENVTYRYKGADRGIPLPPRLFNNIPPRQYNP